MEYVGLNWEQNVLRVSKFKNSHSFHKNAILSTFLKHDALQKTLLLLSSRLYKSILLPSSHDDSFYPHSHGYFCRDTDLLTVINMMSCFGPEMGLPKKEVPPPLKCCRVRSHTITKVSLRARVGVKNVIFDQRRQRATHSCRRLQEDQKWNLTHLSTKICCHSKHTTLDKYYPNSKHMR